MKTTIRRLGSLLALATTATLALAQAPNAEGEVRKIDATQGKVTIKHGEIKNLDMPPMTMVFKLRDPAALKGVAVGDKVRFAAEKLNGEYTVTAIVKAP